MIKKKIIYLIPFLTLISVFFGVYLGEDSLGGGKHDYNTHLGFLYGFTENFYDTYKKFGIDEEFTKRNSPILYIFFSLFLKIGFHPESLRIINFLILVPIIIYFIKCLEIKYPNIDSETKIFFFSALLLSPTIRTLIIWPYPVLWALCFFLISIYYFLIFNKTNDLNKKIIYAYLNIFFLSLSAYFTPKFAVFSIYFFYNFFLFYKYKPEILKIIILNLIFAIPAIYFLITKDFYLFVNEPFDVNLSTKYNFSNKIIIISSMIFLFFLPFVSKKAFFNNRDFFKINYKFLITLVFIFINIYFFDFLTRSGGGGGIFFQFSHKLFGNSAFLFIIFILSIGLFGHLGLFNFNNILLFFILLIYNLEFTIYYKYFEPLLFFLLLFMTNYKKDFININKISKKIFLFYILFLILNFSKSYMNF